MDYYSLILLIATYIPNSPFPTWYFIIDHASSVLTGVLFISVTEIQNARGIVDVLSEMIDALDPANKEVWVLNFIFFWN